MGHPRLSGGEGERHFIGGADGGDDLDVAHVRARLGALGYATHVPRLQWMPRGLVEAHADEIARVAEALLISGELSGDQVLLTRQG